MVELDLQSDKLSEREVYDLAAQFGGQWCSCIHQVVSRIRPVLVAAYCEMQEYKKQHPVIRDSSGVRYGYYLKDKTEVRSVDGREETKQFKLIAGFGDFNRRPYETLQSCLKAISAIAEFERRSPQEVANDVIDADEKQAPEIPDKEEDERGGPPISEGSKRYYQDSSRGGS